MDILSHLIEQYFDRSKNNDASKGMMEGLMRTVIKWAPIAVKEPHNSDARANLMWSATMALNGLVSVANENGWTVHSLEHELSAYYDITHGVGLGILTPRWMEFILTKIRPPRKYLRDSDGMFGTLKETKHTRLPKQQLTQRLTGFSI